jgi:hypothetical protein
MKNVGQKFSRSRNIFSEISVVTPENKRTVHPEGKQLEKENDESCGQQKIISRSKSTSKQPIVAYKSHTWK